MSYNKYLSSLCIDVLTRKYEKNFAKYNNIKFIIKIMTLFESYKYIPKFLDFIIFDNTNISTEEMERDNKKIDFNDILLKLYNYLFYKHRFIINSLTIKGFNSTEIYFKFDYNIDNECMKDIGNIFAIKYLKLNIKEIYGDLYSYEYTKIYNILKELKKYIFMLESFEYNKIITKDFIDYFKLFDENIYKLSEEYFTACKKVVINELQELFIYIEDLLNDKLRLTWTHLVVSINSK